MKTFTTKRQGSSQLPCSIAHAYLSSRAFLAGGLSSALSAVDSGAAAALVLLLSSGDEPPLARAICSLRVAQTFCRTGAAVALPDDDVALAPIELLSSSLVLLRCAVALLAFVNDVIRCVDDDDVVVGAAASELALVSVVFGCDLNTQINPDVQTVGLTLK